MPMNLDEPIIIPPKPAVEANEMEAIRINIEDTGNNKYAIGLVLNFFARNQDGTKTYVYDSTTGRKLEEHLSHSDILSLAGDIPQLLQAFGALQNGIVAYYRYSKIPPPAPTPDPETPPAPEPEQPPEEPSEE